MDTTKESVEYNVAACDRLNPREDDMTQGLNMSTSDGMTPNHLQLRNEILIHLEAAKKSIHVLICPHAGQEVGRRSGVHRIRQAYVSKPLIT